VTNANGRVQYMLELGDWHHWVVLPSIKSMIKFLGGKNQIMKGQNQIIIQIKRRKWDGCFKSSSILETLYVGNAWGNKTL